MQKKKKGTFIHLLKPPQSLLRYFIAFDAERDGNPQREKAPENPRKL